MPLKLVAMSLDVLWVCKLKWAPSPSEDAGKVIREWIVPDDFIKPADNCTWEKWVQIRASNAGLSSLIYGFWICVSASSFLIG